MPEFLEITADKFTFRVATDRRYTPQGIWVLEEPGTQRVRIGLADYLQQHNGDVAFANVKPAGTKLSAGAPFGEIETIKALVELASPVSGTIVQVNPALDQAPEVINQNPYEGGWLAVVETTSWATEREQLLDAPAYFQVVQAQVHQELKNP